MSNEDIENIIIGVKLIYMKEIMNIADSDRRQYYNELVASVPDNPLHGYNNPRKALIMAKKIGGFFETMRLEMVNDGIDVSNIEKEIEENNNMFRKALHVPKWVKL